jgi:hypothetical protein
MVSVCSPVSNQGQSLGTGGGEQTAGLSELGLRSSGRRSWGLNSRVLDGTGGYDGGCGWEAVGQVQWRQEKWRQEKWRQEKWRQEKWRRKALSWRRRRIRKNSEALFGFSDACVFFNTSRSCGFPKSRQFSRHGIENRGAVS